MSRLFRILNDNETIGVVYDSKEHTSPRKQEIIRLWDTLKAVCRFSKETGISLQTAYNTGMKIMDGTERLSDDQGDVIISNYPNHGKRFYTEMKKLNIYGRWYGKPFVWNYTGIYQADCIPSAIIRISGTPCDIANLVEIIHI